MRRCGISVLHNGAVQGINHRIPYAKSTTGTDKLTNQGRLRYLARHMLREGVWQKKKRLPLGSTVAATNFDQKFNAFHFIAFAFTSQVHQVKESWIQNQEFTYSAETDLCSNSRINQAFKILRFESGDNDRERERENVKICLAIVHLFQCFQNVSKKFVQCFPLTKKLELFVSLPVEMIEPKNIDLNSSFLILIKKKREKTITCDGEFMISWSQTSTEVFRMFLKLGIGDALHNLFWNPTRFFLRQQVMFWQISRRLCVVATGDFRGKRSLSRSRPQKDTVFFIHISKWQRFRCISI